MSLAGRWQICSEKMNDLRWLRRRPENESKDVGTRIATPIVCYRLKPSAAIPLGAVSWID